MELLRMDPSDESGTTYYGYATPGTQDNDALWSIKRKSIDGAVLKYEYPYIAGTNTINSYPSIASTGVEYMQFSGLVWTDRSGYTYK